MTMLKDGLLVAGLVLQFFLVLAGFRKRNMQLSYSFFVYLLTSFVSSYVVSNLIDDRATSRWFYTAKEFTLADSAWAY